MSILLRHNLENNMVPSFPSFFFPIKKMTRFSRFNRQSPHLLNTAHGRSVNLRQKNAVVCLTLNVLKTRLTSLAVRESLTGY